MWQNLVYEYHNPILGNKPTGGAMIGIADAGVCAAAALAAAGVLLCVGYGLWRWNDEDEDGPPRAGDRP